MADVAAVFHWGPAELAAMPLDELLDWQRLAVQRWKRMQG